MTIALTNVALTVAGGAVIDIRQPRVELAPGKIAAADFFDEAWQFKKQ